eukprot:EG_transcript_5078
MRLFLGLLACYCIAGSDSVVANLSWPPVLSAPSLAPSCGPFTEVLGGCCDGPEEFRRVANAMQPVTDKVDGHFYHLMYGVFLGPVRSMAPFKFFEIGLGCNMEYGPGASARLWRRFLAEAELWEADVDEKCIASHAQRLQEARIHALHGNQANPDDLRRWIQSSAGQFNAVVDDGGHHNAMILTSFAHLWPEVLPGGLYFLEDLQMGRTWFADDTGGMVFSDVVQAWLEELVVGFPSCDPAARKAPASLAPHDLWRLPAGTQWVFCQPEACALRKAPVAAAGLASPTGPSSLAATLLQPLQNASFQPRVLVYGLRCAGRTATVRRWRTLVPRAVLWLLNPEPGCKLEGSALGEGVKTSRLPRGKLRSWLSPGQPRFDVAVDDSNATDVDLLESYLLLSHCLKGTGLYVMLHLSGRSPAKSDLTVPGVLQAWVDALLVGKQKYNPKFRPSLPSGTNPWRFPADLLFVGCEHDACVLGRWPLKTQHVVNYRMSFPVTHKSALNTRYQHDLRCL